MHISRFDKKKHTHTHNNVQLQKQSCGKLAWDRIRKTEVQRCSNEQFIKFFYEKGNYNKKTTVDLSTPLNQQKKSL